MSLTGKVIIDRLGWKAGPAIGEAIKLTAGMAEAEALACLAAIAEDPAAALTDGRRAPLARHLLEAGAPAAPSLRNEPVPGRVWGASQIDAAALAQFETARRLPVAVRAAQMPDGHVGYGLPIGGVLATENAVIPYAVGVDIGCRMKLSIADIPANRLEGMRDRLRKSLVAETCFGVGGSFKPGARSHDVMDDPAWGELHPAISRLRDKAAMQLGTSGSGNHFASWCEVEVGGGLPGVEAGRYIALLSHSGSRGFGAAVADFYTKVAMEKCASLPDSARRLAWLDLDWDAGREYWAAMNLAGAYAAANHDCVHRHVLRATGLKPLLVVENAHNLAWREEHDGREVIVHRKGATPAAAGQLGVIPGTMADPAYVVRGLGNAESLRSASHGAGRRLSRSAAMKSITPAQMRNYLAERGVELISGGLDEAPMAYKNIDEVMAAQADLVEIVAKITPRIVLMAGDGGDEG